MFDFLYSNIKPCFPAINLRSSFHMPLSFVVLLPSSLHSTATISSAFLLSTYFITSFQNIIFTNIGHIGFINFHEPLNSCLDIFSFNFQILLLTACCFFTTYFYFRLSMSVTSNRCCNSHGIDFSSFKYFPLFQPEINIIFIFSIL